MLIGLAGCTSLDNYLLGQDNTLQPQALSDVKTRVHLREAWRVSLGKPDDSSYLRLMPTVHDTNLYVANHKGRLMRVDTRTGHVDWIKQFPYGFVSGPVFQHDQLALGTDRASVVVIDAKTGIMQREFLVSEDVLASPLWANDVLLAKTIDGRLYALDIKTGRKKWSYAHGAPSLILKSSASPVKTGHVVLAGFSDGRLDAVDFKTGRLLWQRSIVYATGASDVERLVDLTSDPVIDEHRIYVATYQGEIAALTLESGALLWHKPASTYQNISTSTTSLLMVDAEDTIWSFKKKDGQVIWTQEGLKHRGLTAPFYHEGYAYVGDQSGFLHVLDAQGQLVGRQWLGSGIKVAPVVVGDHVYVITTSGQLVCDVVSLR